VDSVRSDQQGSGEVGAVRQCEPDMVASITDVRHLLVGSENACGKSLEHAPIQLGSEHPDETPAVFVDDGLGQPDICADAATRIAECRMARCAEVLRVNAHLVECFDGRWPQVEDIPGGPGLSIPFEDHHLMPCRGEGKSARHAGGAASEDDYRILVGCGCHRFLVELICSERTRFHPHLNCKSFTVCR